MCMRDIRTTIVTPLQHSVISVTIEEAHDLPGKMDDPKPVNPWLLFDNLLHIKFAFKP